MCSVVRMPFRSVVALVVASAALVLAACSGEDAGTPEAPALVLPETDASAPPPVTAARPEAPVDAGDDAQESACMRALRDKGISVTPTVARGVEEAVHLNGDVLGVRFTNGDTDKLAKDPMACAFVLTLARFAEILKAHGVDRVGTLGSYCYRCCCAWSPTNDCRSPSDPEPDCAGLGYSNHSWGRAIDVKYLHLASGQTYDIEKASQWVVSGSGTCGSGLKAQKGVSQFLYALVCEVANAPIPIFKTILTPNYNADHRNHWHMDTGSKGEPDETTIRRSIGTSVDVGGEGADRCGGG